MSKAIVVETQRQHVGAGVTQSLNVGITTIGVEMVLVPNIDVVRRGVLAGFTKRLGSRLSGVPVERNPTLQQKRGILRSKYHRKQQRKQFPKTRSSEQQFLANS